MTTLRPTASLLGAALLTLGSTASIARADPFHAQTLPLGQRALGMGGAFTAVADDPSSAYYNPAGIALTGDSSLSASLTLTAFDRSDVEGGYRTSAGSSALSHSTGASLPVFVAAVKHIGPRDAEGRRRHAISLSTFTVSQRRLSYDVEVNVRATPGGSDTGLETLSIDSAHHVIWHGLSYSYRVSGPLAIGFSGFLSVTRTHYAEERIGALLGAVDPSTMTYETQASSWTSHLVDGNVKGLLGRFGVLYAWSEQLRLGLMFQPPSIHVRGQAHVRERRLMTDLGGDAPESSLYTASQRGLGSRNPTPWELRLGASYRPKHWLTLAVDGSMYGRTGSKRDPVVAVGKRRPDPITGAEPALGAFASETWYREYNGNLAFGGEAVIKDSIAIRAGLYTDLSSAPRLPRFSETFRPSHVHRVGGALSVGLVSDGYDLSLGCIGVFGRGQALSFSADPTSDAVYERTHVTDRTFLVFVNGVRNAVKSLARRAEERILGAPKR